MTGTVGAAASNVLSVADVHFSYGTGLEVLAGVSFQLGRGEVLALVGPSGCGKSTLLGALTGILPLGHGRVTWSDGDAGPRDGRSGRRFTLVFQHDTVLPWLTVEKNIAFGLRYTGLDRRAMRERVDMLLGLANLTSFRRAYPKALSGGMRRRVALLTGVAPLPRVLLLDEAFVGLDEPTRVGLHADLLKIVYELGLSVMFVTHDLGEAVSIADRVCLLSARPTHVSEEYAIPFGHERDVRQVRERAEFQRIYSSLWHDLQSQVQKAQTSDD